MDGEAIDLYGLREAVENIGERKRQGVDVPFPDGQGADLSSACTMCDEFDLVTFGGKFLYPFGGQRNRRSRDRLISRSRSARICFCGWARWTAKSTSSVRSR